MTDGCLTAATARIVQFAERWFPDAFVFVLAAVVLVAGAALLHGSTPIDVSRAFGDGFWTLLPFTLQMAYVAIGGFVVATSPPAARLLDRLAAVPSDGRWAIVFVGLVSIVLSLVNWGLSLIFSGLLVRQIARRTDLVLDYRAAGAAAYLGLGCGFTLGISSSAAQLQATASSIPASLLPLTGVIPLSMTIFTWQNAVTIAIVTAVSATICYVTAPAPAAARTAADLDIALVDAPDDGAETPSRPGDFLDDSPILPVLVAALAIGWIGLTIAEGTPLALISGLNAYNFLFLMAGLVLHWRPRHLVAAFSKATPSVAGVLLQFPFYAGIAHILTATRNAEGLTLSDSVAALFVGASSSAPGFSVLVGLYSAVLGFFIPSAGGKWVIEAPYLAEAANAVGAHLGWTVMVYNITETLPNFINPFWMLPLLGILGLKAKDVVGYTAMQFVVHLPLALLLGALLMSTFQYVPPIMP